MFGIFGFSHLVYIKPRIKRRKFMFVEKSDVHLHLV